MRGKVMVSPNEGRPYAAVLRRGQILGLIAQQPRNRFDAIRPFLDIDAVEKSAVALKQLIDQETANERTASARIEENRVAVENSLAGGWAARTRGAGMGALRAAQGHVRPGSGVRQPSEPDRPRRSVDRRGKAARGKARPMPRWRLLPSKRQRHRLHRSRRWLRSKLGDLVAVLQAADAYFQTHDHTDTCPLCTAVSGQRVCRTV